MLEYNPDNPLVQSLRGQWDKLAALIMYKAGMNEVRINLDDMQKFVQTSTGAIVAQIENAGKLDETIVFRLMSMEDAIKLEKRMNRNN